MHPSFTKPKRFYVHCSKLYITVRTKYCEYRNRLDENRIYGCLEEDAIVLGFEPKLFDYEDIYYDGHLFASVTFLGIKIGRMYTYDTHRIPDEPILGSESQ